MTTKPEVERKYELPVVFALPDLTTVPGTTAVDEPVEHRLDATYYDTAELRLAANRVTVRRRTGGTDAGWHVKRPGDGEGRLETQFPLGSADEVPSEVTETVRPLSGGEPLEPVVRIRTRRTERAVRGPDGTVLALVADDAVTSQAFGATAIVQHWRELEVELVDGSPELLEAIDAALRDAGARRADLPSKLAHALGDRYPAADRDTGTDTDTDTTAAETDDTDDALTAYLRAQRDAIRTNEPGVRAGNADAVHDLRVASRRVRSTLRTFRKVLDPAPTGPLADELKWLAGLLGAMRDADVLAERLAAAVAAEPPELVIGPVAARIEQRLAAGTARARADLVAALDGPRYAALLDALDALVDAAGSTPAPPARLRRAARKALRRADDRLDAASTDEQLHDSRKAYKRARYAAELLEPVAGKAAGRLAKRLRGLQDVLGAHQDSIVTRQLLRDYGIRAHADGENAFTYGLLHARQQHEGQRSRAAVGKARRRAGRRSVRRWLTA